MYGTHLLLVPRAKKRTREVQRRIMRAVDEASASLRLTDLGLKDGEVPGATMPVVILQSIFLD